MDPVAETSVGIPNTSLAKPLHIQRLEHATRLEPYLSFLETIFHGNNAVSDADTSDNETDSDDDTDDASRDVKVVNGVASTKQERKAEKMHLYNFSKVKKSRKWLKNILLTDSSDDSDDDDNETITEDKLQDMLRMHKLMKSHQNEFHADKDLQQYQYYSVGLLSNQDKFYEHQKLIVGNKKKSKDKKMEKKIKAKLKKMKMRERKMHQAIKMEDEDYPGEDGRFQDSPDGLHFEDAFVDTYFPKPKRKTAAMSEMSLNMKRKKLWTALSKKEISKAQKQKVSAHKEMLTNCKKMAQACQKDVRRAAIQSQKALKENPSRAKRLTREMLVYWKRYEKVEKEHRKRAEKEAQEQLKMDIELREAKRQQRKLNFLITQTELYAHFMSRKMGISKENLKDVILGQLDEQSSYQGPAESGMVLDIDDDCYDSDQVKNQALKNVQNAYDTHQAKTRTFDIDLAQTVKGKKNLNEDFKLTDPSISTDQDRPQPNIFDGKLKTYQLKGMNWLANLYDQGLNGILADEMGLGKTVQSIAFLAHIAESQGIWGPFLVIAPSSTLHNWQQEFSRFVPKFKVVPYWGNITDRKILRKFWDQKDLHTETASFHVLVTSYQLVVHDLKYFQRIKWQYMILDEAQAIKCSSSIRWKSLLGFSCRNRLLLTGTPIQNSMAELWALLHFIMPTLFDSHEEFNEWFSKDIESHAENKAMIDEKHLSRLHLILKPFMLRRIKKDVENELSDKIEILLYCQLTARQHHLYEGLKKKISIDDLLHSSASSATSQGNSTTSSLMNLVMQFRKVCNHPELFERREVKSAFFLVPGPFFLPKFLFRNGILQLDFFHLWVLRWFNIYHPEYMHHSLFPATEENSIDGSNNCFSFLRFIKMSPAELSASLSGFVARWLFIQLERRTASLAYHKNSWNSSEGFPNTSDNGCLLIWPTFPMSLPSVESSRHLPSLAFAKHTGMMYSHLDHTYHYIPETAEHCEMRARKSALTKSALLSPSKIVTVQGSIIGGSSVLGMKSPLAKKLQSPPYFREPMKAFSFVEKSSEVRCCQPTDLPGFLSYMTSKAICRPVECRCNDHSAALWQSQIVVGGSVQGMNTLMYGNPDFLQERLLGRQQFFPLQLGGTAAARPTHGWSQVIIPGKETLVTDSGKLNVLDKLLKDLKSQGHRVLIYSQMTRMIDILEEYMWHRKHTYMRLDGSSKIADRRDMVADFQTRSDIFVFLLSTRAGGLGINLTAADTVVFYDSDWNPTVDQQAMDRAHRLGQTKQVTVYRLVCKGTIEERILQRAREKSEIQRMVISGGNFKPDILKPKEVVSLLLDDDELEMKFRQRQVEKKQFEEQGKEIKDKKRKRDKPPEKVKDVNAKRRKAEENVTIPNTTTVASLPVIVQDSESVMSLDSLPASPSPSEKSFSSAAVPQDETSNEGSLIVDDGSPSTTPIHSMTTANFVGGSPVPGQVTPKLNKPGRGSGRGRGRPKGSGKRGGRGRGATLAAAEIAGAQAGLSAAYAAYGYALQGKGTPTLRGGSISRGQHPLFRGGHSSGARGRPAQSKRGAPRQKPATASSSHAMKPNAAPPSSGSLPVVNTAPRLPFMGFYTQQGPDTAT